MNVKKNKMNGNRLAKIRLWKLFSIVLAFFISSQLVQATTWTYPGENQFKSAKYAVKVTQNGESKTSFVYQDVNKHTAQKNSMTDWNHWTTFSFNGTVTIEVTKLDGNIGNAEIRPLSRNYPAQINGNKLTYTLSKPEKLWIKMDGMYEHPLFIFADAPEVNAPTASSGNVVYWGAGVHNVGKHYKLQSNKTYYLAGGAYVKGSFLSDNNASNVTIRGRGILSSEDIAHCGYNECTFAGVAIRFDGSNGKNNVVEGITLINPAQYCLQAYGGDLETYNVKFFGWNYETDGWVAGNGTKLYDSFFKVYDDVVKLYFDNLHIHDLVIYKQHNGAPFQLGWSGENGNDNLVENIDVIYDETNWNQSGLEGNRGFISHANGNSGSTVQRMTFQNINFDENVSYLIGIRSQGTVKDFTLKNINIRGTQTFKSYFNGGNMSGFSFENVKLNGKCITKDADFDLRKNGNVAAINYKGCGATSDPVDPVISFVKPVQNATIKGTFEVQTLAYDADFGTSHGDGVTSVFYQIFKATDPTIAVYSQIVDQAPFYWNLKTTDFANGDYELRAGVASSDFTGRKYTVLKPITINNTVQNGYPKTFTYTGNPWATHIRAADPSAKVFSDGKLWVYASHDQDNATDYSSMDGYHVFSTEDMVTWIDYGEILHSRDVAWGIDGGGWMWAPDCAEKNGKYYLYYPTKQNKSYGGEWFRIGVAVAESPAGPFVSQPLPIQNTGGTDPYCFIDDDGQAYLFFGDHKVAKLKDNMTELAEQPRTVNYGFDNFQEGAHLHKKDGKYYYSWTTFDDPRGTGGFYAIGDSPYGPFTYKGKVADGPQGSQDHHSIVDFKGQSYYFYHRGGWNGGAGYKRNLMIDYLCYNEDGTMKKVEYTTKGVGPAGTGPCLDVVSNPLVDPVISFVNPIINSSISGNYQVQTLAYDADYGTAHGNGVTSVFYQIFNASDPTVSLFSVTVDQAPFYWNLKTTDFANGDYELRAGVASADFTGRKYAVLKPVIINNQQIQTPQDITDLKVTKTTCTQVQLSWTDTQGEEAYRVRRKLSNENTYQILDDLPANSTMYTDQTIEEGKNYIYMIRPMVAGVAVKISNTPEAFVPNCVVTSLDLTKDELVIYPNPTSGLVHVLYQEGAELKLINTFSQTETVMIITSNDFVIDMSIYPSGIYHLHVINNGDVKSYALVKE